MTEEYGIAHYSMKRGDRMLDVELRGSREQAEAEVKVWRENYSARTTLRMAVVRITEVKEQP